MKRVYKVVIKNVDYPAKLNKSWLYTSKQEAQEYFFDLYYPYAKAHGVWRWVNGVKPFCEIETSNGMVTLRIKCLKVR